EMADERGLVADLNVGDRPLSRTDALDEVFDVQIGPIFRGRFFARHPRPGRAAAAPAALQFGDDFVADAVGQECAVGAVERLAVRAVVRAGRAVVALTGRPAHDALAAERATLIAHDEAGVLVGDLEDVGRLAAVFQFEAMAARGNGYRCIHAHDLVHAVDAV